MTKKRFGLIFLLIPIVIFISACETCGNSYCASSELNSCVQDCFDPAQTLCNDNDDGIERYGYSQVSYNSTYNFANPGDEYFESLKSGNPNIAGINNDSCSGTLLTEHYCGGLGNKLPMIDTYDCLEESLICNGGRCEIDQITPTGSSITINKSTRLLSDFNYVDSGTAITVEVDNIVIDCYGHKITGSGAGTGINAKNHSNLQIKNCDISNLDIGLNLTNSKNAKIIGNNFTSNNDIILPDPFVIISGNIGDAPIITDNKLSSGFNYKMNDSSADEVEFLSYDYYNYYDSQNYFQFEGNWKKGRYGLTNHIRAQEFAKDPHAGTTQLVSGLCSEEDNSSVLGDEFMGATCNGESNYCTGDGKCFKAWVASYPSNVGIVVDAVSSISHEKVRDIILNAAPAQKKDIVGVSNPTKKIILPDNCGLQITLEKLSNSFQSEIWLEQPNQQQISENSSNQGEIYYIWQNYDPNVPFNNQSEIIISLKINEIPWNNNVQTFFSNDPSSSKIEQLDYDSWRIYFEGISKTGGGKTNKSFNDVVVLLDAICGILNQTVPTDPEPDCDMDGIPDWLDTDDGLCDIGGGLSNITKEYDANGFITNFGVDYFNYTFGDSYFQNDFFYNQTLQFMLYGYNNKTTDAEFTYAIYDNTDGGDDRDNLTYIGNISNSLENLIIPQNTEFIEKNLSILITNDTFITHGKHTIWIIDPSNPTKDKKIGEFYVVEDIVQFIQYKKDDQTYPMLWGDKLIWQDNRNGNLDIYMYNFSTNTETQITTNPNDQKWPNIRGDIIAWVDMRNGNADIYMYNISTSTETQVTTSGSHQWDPAVYGDLIVYEDQIGGIYEISMYNISNGVETHITNSGYHTAYPDIFEDIIVWQDISMGPTYIFMYNLTSGIETQVTNGPGVQTDAKIYKNLIIYETRINATRDVYLYNISNGQHKQITNDPLDQMYPAIYGNIIVWTDFRNGNQDVFMYDILTSTEYQVSKDTSSQWIPEIYENKIVWQDERNGDFDIYMAVLPPGMFSNITSNITLCKNGILDNGEECDDGNNVSGDGCSELCIDEDGIQTCANNIIEIGEECDTSLGIIPNSTCNPTTCFIECNEDYIYNITTELCEMNIPINTTQGVCEILNETQLTLDPAAQSYPMVYGDKVIYQDNRNGNLDIYMYNLSSSTETRITTNPSDQKWPNIRGNKIVWVDMRNGNADIYMYNLDNSTETQITTSGSNQWDPAIYGDLIVYEDQRGSYQISMYNLSNGQETYITNHGSNTAYPDIYGKIITWQDNRFTSTYIFMYDLSTGTETQVTNGPGVQSDAKIYNNLITYESRDGATRDVYLYNISNGQHKQITNQSLDEMYPAIYGNIIIWTDFRNGNQDVYMYDIAHSTEQRVSWNITDQWVPEIYKNKIVWYDNRNGNSDIYMTTLSPGCLNTPINNIPHFTQNLTNQTINQTNTFNYDINCSDIEDIITYSSNSTDWSINPTTGTISYNYLPTDVGNHSYTVFCSDGINTISQIFSIEVLGYCGDGSTQLTEECDDGNLISNDSCSNLCQFTFCGDNITQINNGNSENEICDGTDTLINSTCSLSCDQINCNEDYVLYNNQCIPSICEILNETRITTNIAAQTYPMVYEDKVIYQDNRNGNLDIYMYNLSSSTETRITTNPSDQKWPNIRGDKIVWVDMRNGNSDIYMYNLDNSTETQITTSGSNQWDPAIYGDLIVYEDQRGSYQISMYNLSNGVETYITNNGYDAAYPDIFGDTIVWQDISVGPTYVFMYNLSTSTRTQVTNGPGVQSDPKIYNNLITYESRDGATRDVYLYNISNGQHKQITNQSLDEMYPAIYGNIIIWTDFRNGNQDVYMYDISNLTEQRVSWNITDQWVPEIYKDKIVWYDNRNGNSDIYMATLSPGCLN